MNPDGRMIVQFFHSASFALKETRNWRQVFHSQKRGLGLRIKMPSLFDNPDMYNTGLNSFLFQTAWCRTNDTHLLDI